MTFIWIPKKNDWWWLLCTCLDKRDIISSELDACTKLLRHAIDETDKKTIEIEISELKLALDLMH